MRRTATLGFLAAVVGGAGLLCTARAGAQSGGTSYRLTARADVASVEVVDTAAPLVVAGQVAFVTPGTAQATVDSIGSSEAFASTPYPGDFVVTLPGVVNSTRPAGTPAVPDYPLAARSSHPTAPAARQEAGPYGLSAASTATESTGRTALGLATGDPQVASATADALARWDDQGTGFASAAADVDGLSIGSVLRLGELRAEAAITVQPGGEPQKTSSLSLGSITVSGVEVGLTEQGLQVGDAAVPLGPVADVGGALAAAGIELEYLPGTETDTSITSAGVAITYGVDVPTQGLVRTTLVVGSVTVSARAAELPSAPSAGAAPSAPPAAPPPVAAASAPLPVMVPAAPAAAPAPVADLPVGELVASFPDIGPSTRTLYAVLLVAGLAAVAGSRAIGLLGVRVRP